LRPGICAARASRCSIAISVPRMVGDRPGLPEKKTLVFVEVKTRGPGNLGRPADAVDSGKEEALMRGAQAWLRMLGEPGVPVRIDIVEVIVGERRPEITLTRDALAFTGER